MHACAAHTPVNIENYLCRFMASLKKRFWVNYKLSASCLHSDGPVCLKIETFSFIYFLLSNSCNSKVEGAFQAVDKLDPM